MEPMDMFKSTLCINWSYLTFTRTRPELENMDEQLDYLLIWEILLLLEMKYDINICNKLII